MKNNLLKVLKSIIYLIVVGTAVGFIFHFMRGIYCSLFADDVITAQNRVESAYQFLYMIGNGVVLVIALYSTSWIKVQVLPVAVRKKIEGIFAKIKAKLTKKEG